MTSDYVRLALDRCYAQIEELCWQGVEQGKDVAVNEFEFTIGEVKFEAGLIDPGAVLPPGKRWTIYHASQLKAGHA